MIVSSIVPSAANWTGIIPMNAVGTKLTPHFGVEGELATGTNHDTTTTGQYKLSSKVAGYGVGYLPVSSSVDLIGRVGLSDTDLKAPASAGKLEQGTAVDYGVGAQYHFNGDYAARLDVTKSDFQGHKGTANATTDPTTNATTDPTTKETTAPATTGRDIATAPAAAPTAVAGDGMPPDRPKKPVLAGIAIGGAVLLAIPILLIGTGSHHGKKHPTADAAATVLPGDGQQPPPGAYVTTSPSATPTAAPSATAKSTPKAAKSAAPKHSAQAQHKAGRGGRDEAFAKHDGLLPIS